MFVASAPPPGIVATTLKSLVLADTVRSGSEEGLDRRSERPDKSRDESEGAQWDHLRPCAADVEGENGQARVLHVSLLKGIDQVE